MCQNSILFLENLEVRNEKTLKGLGILGIYFIYTRYILGIYIIGRLRYIFCTSQPQNVLKLFQSQPRSSYKDCSDKKSVITNWLSRV